MHPLRFSPRKKKTPITPIKSQHEKWNQKKEEKLEKQAITYTSTHTHIYYTLEKRDGCVLEAPPQEDTNPLSSGSGRYSFPRLRGR